MSRFTDFFWPTLEKPTPAERADDDALEATDIATARTGSWTRSPELAVEEARRLADSEEDRRRATEGKASTYLLFAAAFAAALIPFLPGILEGKTGSAPRWLIALILIIATFYLMAAGIWAFRTLRVGTYHRLDVADLGKIWGQKNPPRALIRETLALARMNYRAVNAKVSCIKMAHEFMARSFVAFGVLVVVEAGWEAVHSAVDANRGHVVTETKERSNPDGNGAAEPDSHSVSSPNSILPNPGTKPPPSAPASNRIEPGTQLPAPPAANVGAASSGTSASDGPSPNNPASPIGSAPQKQ